MGAVNGFFKKIFWGPSNDIRTGQTETPLYRGGSVMSYVNPKSFFYVTVGGFLSVEPCPTASRYRGGPYPIGPDFRTIVRFG